VAVAFAAAIAVAVVTTCPYSEPLWWNSR